ncbi:MAG TPA: TonB-dependent receptor, partial [Chthoniobacteraceae bacterium]
LTGAQVVYVNRLFRGQNTSPLGFQVHDDHFLSFDPKIGLTYEWNEKTMAYLNFSRSFQPPSFDESLNTVSNPGGGEEFNLLNAQKAWTLEIGTRGEQGPLEWDLALYRSWVRDELISLANASGAVTESMNAPKTVHQGIEFGASLELAHDILAKGVHLDASKDGKTIATDRNGDRLVLRQSYNYSDFRFSDHPIYGNNRIGGNPVAFYKAELRYEHPCGIYFGPNLEWNVVKYPVDEANTLYADPYALLGFKAGYKTKKGLQVYFEVKNILNKTYADNVEPIADARLGDSDSFNPGNGRAFYGGVSWIW